MTHQLQRQPSAFGYVSFRANERGGDRENDRCVELATQAASADGYRGRRSASSRFEGQFLTGMRWGVSPGWRIGADAASL